jgi:hypothetical protein
VHITAITANLGRLDREVGHVAQFLPARCSYEHLCFDDATAPPRPLAVTPRMQSKAYKMLGWDYAPNADAIIWLDAAYRIKSDGFVRWMLARLGAADACFMPHPDRQTLRQEADFMATSMAAGDRYLLTRYRGEPFREQVAHYLADPTFDPTARLISAGCFIYRPTWRVTAMMRSWLAECVRWTLQDQLSLPYVLYAAGISPTWLDSGVFDCPHLEYIGHG